MSNHYIDKYLDELGIVIWPGQVWDLTDPKERAQAAAWLEQTFSEMLGIK